MCRQRRLPQLASQVFKKSPEKTWEPGLAGGFFYLTAQANSAPGSQDCHRSRVCAAPVIELPPKYQRFESWADRALPIWPYLYSPLHDCLQNVPLCTVFREELSQPILVRSSGRTDWRAGMRFKQRVPSPGVIADRWRVRARIAFCMIRASTMEDCSDQYSIIRTSGVIQDHQQTRIRDPVGFPCGFC